MNKKILALLIILPVLFACSRPSGTIDLSATSPVYENNRLVEQKLTNQENKLTTWIRYQYPQKGVVIKIFLSVHPATLGQITGQEEWTGLNDNNDFQAGARRTRKWVYTDSSPFQLIWIEKYSLQNENQVVRKDLVDKNQAVTSSLFFQYVKNEDRPFAFVEKDPSGKVISSFQKYEAYDLEKSLQKAAVPATEIAEWKKLREHPDKFLIAVIDTGFDYNHLGLVTHWWNNPHDPVDGLDNDGNGWADDSFGWDQYADRGLPTESSTALNRGDRPDSHGTHVANIATRGLSHVGLIGFSGDYTRADYIKKISNFLKTHQVKIVNMSLGLPVDIKDQLGLRDAIRAYREMIEDNPETLFVVASGNDGVDIDQNKFRQYPASFLQENVLKVGALEASSLANIKNPQMAKFSNYGIKSVDVLAPGRDIVAARIGGGNIAHSGTSMATPYAVHQISQVWGQLPHLSAKEIKSLILRTVVKINPAPPIRSGGYIDVKQALLTGKLELLKQNPAAINGPNCWNSATFLADLSKGIHHTSDQEFAFLLDSSLCREIPLEQAIAGDIVAFRRYDANNRLLSASFASEVHAYTYLDSKTGFSKNGVTLNAPYVEQTHAEIFKNYRSVEMRNCKILGLNLSQCQMKEKVYRCQSIEQKFKNLSALEKRLLFELQRIEAEKTQESLSNAPLKNDTQNLILDLQKEVHNLQTSDFKVYVIRRLESLSANY